MLKEIKDVRQIEGDAPRRWFTDDYFDLIVWFEADGAIKGFQLCYDKEGEERALTWTKEDGYSHNRVDTGEVVGRAKMTPVLVADGLFAREDIAARFLKASAGIDRGIASFVHRLVKEYTAPAADQA